MTHEKTFTILRDIAAFSRIRRYNGMLPARLGVCYEAQTLEKMVAEGLIECVDITKPCGADHRFYRLMPAGETRLQEQGDEAGQDPACTEAPGREPLSHKECVLLSDVYHYSRISKYMGMAPPHVLRPHAKEDMENLFRRGYLVRIKAKTSGRKRKGYTLSALGLRIMHTHLP